MMSGNGNPAEFDVGTAASLLAEFADLIQRRLGNNPVFDLIDALLSNETFRKALQTRLGIQLNLSYEEILSHLPPFTAAEADSWYVLNLGFDLAIARLLQRLTVDPLEVFELTDDILVNKHEVDRITARFVITQITQIKLYVIRHALEKKRPENLPQTDTEELPRINLDLFIPVLTTERQFVGWIVIGAPGMPPKRDTGGDLRPGDIVTLVGPATQFQVVYILEDQKYGYRVITSPFTAEEDYSPAIQPQGHVYAYLLAHPDHIKNLLEE